MKKILITGGSGFVGFEVCKKLADNNYDVIELGRKPSGYSLSFFEADFKDTLDLFDLLRGLDVVIHIAARAHVMQESELDSLPLYMSINCQTTLTLAKQAAAAGVKRFIFLSSIKVNGEATVDNKAFRYDDPCKPVDAYGISKSKAEEGIKKIAAETGMEVIIIRSPLVYGPGVKANFAAMLKLAERNLPLPLGAIHNKRSLVALDNLVDLIVTCIDHSKAANQTFLVSDDQDASTTELLQLMTRAAGKKPWLIPVPVSWLKLAGKLTGKQAIIDRLCGNLQVDISHTKDMLGWTPPISVEEGIRRCFQR